MDASIKQNARERLQGLCNACPQCDGRLCSGKLPGVASSFRANVEALEKVKLTMRCLHGVTDPDTSTEFLGIKLSIPVMAAPSHCASLHLGDVSKSALNDVAYAESVILGALAGGIIGCGFDDAGGTVSDASFSAIKKVGGRGIPFINPWDGDFLWQRLDSAVETGCSVIGMNINEMGVMSWRAMGGPFSPKTPRELDKISSYLHDRGVKFMIKGVMTPMDANMAISAGVDAIVVSNHGGRVLDGVPGVAEVLPSIVRAVGDRVPVLADGGVRSGTDILKLIALGAKAVLIGRPFTVAAVGGLAEGVDQYVKDITMNLRSAMIMTGCSKISSITSQILA